MDCPKCNNFLKNKEAINKPYSIFIGECIGCAGWWFDGNALEEYRASILPTSRYTVLPNFEPISGQTPIKCSACKENSLLWNNVGSYIIQRCSKCSGIFLSKEQILELVKIEPDPVLEVGFWALILSGFFRT